MPEDKRIRVTVIANRLGGFGGGERWVCEMAKRLNSKFELDIINPVSKNDIVRIKEDKLTKLFRMGDTKITKVECLGIKHRLYGKIDLMVFLPSLRGLTILNKTISKSDVVYELSFNPFILFWSMLFAKLNNKRFILGLHNPDFLIGQAGKEASVFGKIMQKILLFAVKEMHVQTKSQMELLAKARYKGKKHYIPHYLYFKISKKDAISYGNKFNVLLTGRLTIYQKGIDLLKDIVEKTLAEDDTVSFTIIGSGDGDEISRLLEQKHKLNVKYLGFVSDKELKEHYMKSSIFILPSRYETPGLSLLEAQSYGLPAITFDVMGPKDIITKDVQGARIKPFDTSQFAKKIIEFKYKFAERKNYRTTRREIWSEIGARYGESFFIRKFEKMMKE